MTDRSRKEKPPRTALATFSTGGSHQAPLAIAGIGLLACILLIILIKILGF